MTSSTASLTVDPRSRPMESWRARKGVLASRGEVDGPRVDECNAALSFWRLRTFLVREFGLSTERADAVVDRLPATDDQAAAQ